MDDVSFSNGRGEIFGFLGSNGCGKTTTMRMLTGLLPISPGKALLFGRAVDAADLSTRYRVGYMSQLFSLYTELTVGQNLTLHARLYHIEPAKAQARIAELVATFGLTEHLDTFAAAQHPATACAGRRCHQRARDPNPGRAHLRRRSVGPHQFYALLGDLSRKNGVTIFISTHFTNEAARCAHILLMNGGKVLALGTPTEVVARWGGPTLEEAFIACLEAAIGTASATPQPSTQPAMPRPQRRAFSPQRMLAYAHRETQELRRDPIRLSFAIFGMAFLMIVVGYGMNTDVDHVPLAAFDQDQTPESRAFLNSYRGSIYFAEHPPSSASSNFSSVWPAAN